MFVIAGWKQWFGENCKVPEEKQVRQAIRSKLSTESCGYKKMLGDHNPAARQQEIDNITNNASNIQSVTEAHSKEN